VWISSLERKTSGWHRLNQDTGEGLLQTVQVAVWVQLQEDL